jgi:hypothetical protein
MDRQQIAIGTRFDGRKLPDRDLRPSERTVPDPRGWRGKLDQELPSELELRTLDRCRITIPGKRGPPVLEIAELALARWHAVAAVLAV